MTVGDLIVTSLSRVDSLTALVAELPAVSDLETALHDLVAQLCAEVLAANQQERAAEVPMVGAADRAERLLRFDECLRLVASCSTEGPVAPVERAPGGLVELSTLPPVVIVEDDTSCRVLAQLNLQALGVANPQVVASTGLLALEVLSALVAAGTVPALVLLDGHLPDLDGLEVLRWIRAQPALKETPVVMLTGESGVAWIGRAYALGVAGYLVKPIGAEGLGDVLRALPVPWALLPS
ncbi:MAG: response regulator [Mycobacteriales bacterium]|nr:response regulator [Mycobacteriales bacterium]